MTDFYPNMPRPPAQQRRVGTKVAKGHQSGCGSVFLNIHTQKPSTMSQKLILSVWQWFSWEKMLNKYRGCVIIIWTGILHHNSNIIAPRVKSKSICQTYWSRALKWGIVHLCNSKSTGDMIKNKKYHFLSFCIFSIFVQWYHHFFAKTQKLENSLFHRYCCISKSIWATKTYNTSF